MGRFRNICFAITILTCLLQAQGVSKYNSDDENKPYEFGFDVEVEDQKYQHRHEKKDENGLIMGEFGFLTADGVYHVTVYATDENGNFRVLSTKNIRVAPLKTAAPPVKKGHSLPFPPSENAPVTEGPLPVQSCSHCSIPQPPQEPQLNDLAVVARDPAYDNAQYPDQQQNYPDQQQNYPEQQQNYPDQQQNYPEQQQNYPDQQQNYPEQQQNYPDQQQNYPEQQQNYPDQQQNYPDQNQPGERNPKQFDDYPPEYAPQDESNPSKPQLIAAQMQIVDPNTDIYQKGPGEEEGLPTGLTNNDMELLLYTFNYTVGFHGHHEEGYRNGAKKGYYYVTGRDGTRTRVDYEADENGFRPKITQEVLDLLSDDVPKPETEKDEQYGLKGYEFKWLYYPVDSKRR